MVPGGAARRALSAGALALGAALVLAWAVRPVSDGDIWWHLAAGREWALRRVFPTVKHEWLFSLAAFRLYELGGLAALGAAKAALLALAFLLCAARGIRRGADPSLSAAFALWALWASRYFFNERPHAASYLLLASALVLIEEQSLRGRWLWLGALEAVWVNLHGAALVLLPVSLVWVIASRKRPYWASALIGLCALASPQGWGLFSSVWSHQAGLTENVLEWMSPLSPAALRGSLPGLALLAGSFAVLLTSRSLAGGHELFPWDLGLFALLAPMALLSQRHLPLFCLWAAPVAAARAQLLLRRAPAGLRLAAPAFKTAALALEAALFVGALGSPSLGLGLPEGRYPREVLAFMKEAGVGGRVFNDYNWGGYLLWHLGDRVQVFIDGRLLSAYTPKVIEDYQAAVSGEGDAWRQVFRRYEVEAALLRLPSPLAAALAQARGWVPVAFDDQSILYLNDSPRWRALIRANAPAGWRPGRLEDPFEAGRLAQAGADLETRLARQPNLGILHFYRAAWLKSKGKVELARGALERGIERDPGFAPNYNWLGMECRLAGMPERARTLWIRSLRIREDAVVRRWLREAGG